MPADYLSITGGYNAKCLVRQSQPLSESSKLRKLRGNDGRNKVSFYFLKVHPLATTGLVPMVLLVFLNIRICSGIRVLSRQQPRRALTLASAASITVNSQVGSGGGGSNYSHDGRNRRHSKEIRASYLAIGIVLTFGMLNLARIVASSHEVVNTNLIIHCVSNKVRYVPTMTFYKLDFVARMLMVVNSAINFIIYCAVSTPFQVCT
jgi:hypothetical protein